MNAGKVSAAFFTTVLACCVLAGTSAAAKADLSAKQARNALRRVAGLELPSSAVRVKSVSVSGASAATVTAELRSVFRFESNDQGQWHVAEIRTGQDRWEDANLIARALGAAAPAGDCSAPDPPLRGRTATDPSVKRARCLLASLLGVELPSDAIRIQEVDPLPLPLASQPSAIVIAWLRVEARLTNVRSGWQVAELRAGNRDWINLETLVNAINLQKQEQAGKELAFIAVALEKFRRDRGFYVVSDKQSVAIDFLNPRYLSQVIRVDPWHKPYQYLGDRDHFTLRSSGPDGKVDTADDLQLSSPSR